MISVENMGESFWDNKHTVVQADIIRLRRELNTVKHKLDSYEYERG